MLLSLSAGAEFSSDSSWISCVNFAASSCEASSKRGYDVLKQRGICDAIRVDRVAVWSAGRRAVERVEEEVKRAAARGAARAMARTDIMMASLVSVSGRVEQMDVVVDGDVDMQINPSCRVTAKIHVRDKAMTMSRVTLP